ncbi:circadian clock protein KaiC [Longimicrobium sp.]|uniref:circadian clock protein KaiC n=1 Tax=Longimicrobium sp. TaxID=2029185 RepID=UPI002C616879|nr:circadian clock protein KaiC [Longimicrobium sp.]HSU14180.1 circadian clock protein KaiC [Longimicrobium sp.]
MTAALHPVEKLATGIPGFDLIADGGLPLNRATLIAGTAGSAKTVFATHFLAAGIARGQPGVFVTFEDSVDDIRRNVGSFGWDVAAWEAAGTWAFVDASPNAEQATTVVGDFDLGALLARLEHAVRKSGAKRVSLDSLNALFVQYRDHAVLRSELYRITSHLKKMGVTLVFTSERTEEYGQVSMYGVEEFVADNVVILRNLLVDERRRRTLELLKVRGAPHQRGEFPFTITGEGIIALPLSGISLTQTSSSVRLPTGNATLDEMCGGGFFRDSIILLSGATGAGKTLMVTQFLAAGFEAGERCLLFAFEESRDQLYRNAAAWGYDFAGMERDGKLKVVNTYPHAMAMEDHLVLMRDTIESFRPGRVAVDSLSALERVTSVRSFREFVISLTSFLKLKETVGLFTSTTPSLMGGTSVTEKHISTLTDTIILLRYVESYGQMRRGLTVLKMRGSAHDHDIREYTIDGTGMHILGPFRDVSGVLSGSPVFLAGEVHGAPAGGGERHG